MTGSIYDSGYKNQGCGKTYNPNIQWNDCVLSWVDIDGVPRTATFADILGKAADGLTLNKAECSIQYTDTLGVAHSSLQIGDALLSKIQFDLSTGLEDCELTISTATDSTTVNLTSLLQQLAFEYLPNQHAIQRTIKGVPYGAPQFLNCSELSFDLATCQLSYKNEKNQTNSWFIPRDKFFYNAQACQLTIIPSKPGDPTLTIPLGATAQEVGLELLANKTLEFTYKNKKCQVPLPNSLIGCTYDPVACSLELIHCDGAKKQIQFPIPSLAINTLPDGTQVGVFSNGKPGNQTMFNIPAVRIDTDNITVAGSVITFAGGGDGNPQTVSWDICDIVGDNCNATFTSINPDGSWTFINNKGEEFTYPAPKNCCTFHGLSGVTLDPNNPPTAPSNPYPKSDGDTLVECHVNGLAYYTCVAGAWRFDFIKLAEREVFIGPIQPAKIEGYKAWFDPTDCIARFCDEAGNWLEPRTVVCSPTAPECGKGLPQIWFNETDGCLYVCCDGTWISSDTAVVRSVISRICIQLGSAEPIPVPVDENGKVIIPIPDMRDFCVILGDAAPIFPSLTGTDNKFAFKLPAMATPDPFIETCIRIGGPDGQVIPPHLEDDGSKYYLDLPPYPVFEDNDDTYAITINGQAIQPSVGPTGAITWNLPPDCCAYSVSSVTPLVDGTTPGLQNPPTNKTVGSLAIQKHPNGFSVFVCTTSGWLNTWYCIFPTPPNYAITIGGTPVEPSVLADGTVVWDLPGYPEVPEQPTFCIQDKAGNSIDGTYDAEANKVTIQLPPILYCGPEQPAVDGSEGYIWFNPETRCTSVLCDGVWVSSDVSVQQG